MVDAPDKQGEQSSAERICWQCGETFSADLEYCPDDGNQLVELDPSETKDILVGRVFDYRFRIMRKLGEGGMSRVYSARRLDEEGEVALKVLKADFLRNPEVRKRFMYEARVISNLEHDNAVDLFDFGQAPDGSFYMVMELLEGQSLADRLDGGALSYREIFAIVPSVCEVLAEAHEQDVIHRDLKPENIFLTETDRGVPNPKLLDFGIAKHLRSRTMTENDQLWGTPAYMSPEQASGDPVAGTADIYATGVMLYELVAGVLPFRASTAMGFAVKHMHREASSMLEVPGLEDVPGRLDAFVQEMLEKSPADRPESMDVVARELRAIEQTLFDEKLLDTVPSLQTNYEDIEAPSDEELSPEDVPADTAEDLAEATGENVTDVISRAEIEAGEEAELETPARGSAVETGNFETPVFEGAGSDLLPWFRGRAGLAAVGIAVAAGLAGLLYGLGLFSGAASSSAEATGNGTGTTEDAGRATVVFGANRKREEGEPPREEPTGSQAATTAAGIAAGVAVRARSVAAHAAGEGETSREPTVSSTPESGRPRPPGNPSSGESTGADDDTDEELSDENVDEALESTF